MHIRGENKYCIGITGDEAKQSCARVSSWTETTDPHQVCYRLSISKTTFTVTPNQYPGYPAFSNSDRTKNNFLSDTANTLAGMFTAGKNSHRQNRCSGIAAYRIAQRHVVFQNRMFDLQIVN
jgi:hypothetical protein